MDIAKEKDISSRIFTSEKTNVDLNVYVVNDRGIVIYDSFGKYAGQDFSRWNDVYLSLQGKYGARSTRTDKNDPSTSSFYVAAPIYYRNKIIGAVTVIKPKNSISPFMENAKIEIAKMAALVLAMLLGTGFLITFWFTRPISALTEYAENLRLRKKVKLPSLGRSEISILGKSMEKMHIELEGKKYVEEYIQTLTHEIKSPLSSIRAASELLEEGAPENKISRLHTGIQKGIERITEITDRMLSLSLLENQSELSEIENINLSELCLELNEIYKNEAESKNISLAAEIPDNIFCPGDTFLLRQAVENLIRNALSFTESGGFIKISLLRISAEAVISVENSGPGIPEYALDHVFDKFFSLPGPVSGRRSSGLGLPFVKQTAELHGGSASVRNTGSGVIGSITLPVKLKV